MKPVAGLGRRVGLKGSDNGLEVQALVHRLGAYAKPERDESKMHGEARETVPDRLPEPEEEMRVVRHEEAERRLRAANWVAAKDGGL